MEKTETYQNSLGVMRIHVCRLRVHVLLYIKSRIIVDSRFHPVLFMEEDERIGHVSRVQIHIAT